MKHFSLKQLQSHVAQAEASRGFADQSIETKCLLLGEEVGELFKAVRRVSGVSVDPASEVRNVGDELADILNFLLAIANRCGIDLGEAFENKEAVNDTRKWMPRGGNPRDT